MRTVALSIASVVLLGLLIYDFCLKEAWGPVDILLVRAQGGDFEGDLRAYGSSYDAASHSFKFTFALQVKRDAKEDEITRVSFTPMLYTTAPGTTQWLVSDAANATVPCTLELKKSDGRQHEPLASFTCTNFEFPAIVKRTEIWYPFDSYSVTVNPQACANSNGVCRSPYNVLIKNLEVAVADPNLTIGWSPQADGSVDLVLHRRFFVRMVSVVFLALSVAFLGYLVALSEPRDLLQKSIGFFAALWGLRALIVPASVNVFPTIVDYCILSLFCFLFLLVLMKLKKGEAVK